MKGIWFIMKMADKDKPLHTLPKGVYEGGEGVKEYRDTVMKKEEITTDLQGNGYPLSKSKK